MVFAFPGIRGIIKFVIDMAVAWMNGGYGSRILVESAGLLLEFAAAKFGIIHSLSSC